MSKRRGQTAATWSVGRRRLASCAIALHLAAVFIAPWAAPPPSSRLAQELAQSALFSRYLPAMFLNHGYRFFAPDPGPSHLVRYELQRDDGTEVAGRIPDPEAYQPRLLYHRYFMMTETLFTLWSRLEEIPPDVPLTPGERAQIEQVNRETQSRVDALASGLARDLLTRHQGTSVRLYIQEHSIPYPDDVLEGRKIDDPALYSDMADLGVFPRAQE